MTKFHTLPVSDVFFFNTSHVAFVPNLNQTLPITVSVSQLWKALTISVEGKKIRQITRPFEDCLDPPIKASLNQATEKQVSYPICV